MYPLQSARQLLAILDVTGSTFELLKYKLVTLGFVFFAGEGSAASAAECRVLLRAARSLAYPEVPSTSAGNEDFAHLCGNYCYLLRNHPREEQLRGLIHIWNYGLDM